MSAPLGSKYYQALAYLLPTGYAWPRDPNSTLMRVLQGIAGTFSELDAFTAETVRQWQPYYTVARLPEWEAATGLPDTCFGADQTLAQRRKLLLARLRGPELVYADSSPGAVGSLEGICRWLGFDTATVAYNTPFRVGRRVGARLGRLDGTLWVRVTLEAKKVRVGRNRVGERLSLTALQPSQLVCYLGRVVPARFNPQLDLTYI